MFGSDEDDGSGFSLGIGGQKSSKLSSLFGHPGQASGNESLMYNPQKQPSQKSKEPPKENKAQPDTPQLLFATACHTYKYTDGQYESQGKLGAAILGNHKNKDYKILIYQGQKKPVTNAKIHESFIFNIQKNNYATFYDDNSSNWSICFDSESSQEQFAKWVCLSKFNSSSGELMQQDLNAVGGQDVQQSDAVEMQYTGWLLQDNTFGKVFDSNKDSGKLLKFKVGKGKVIKGWDTGVIGMKKGMKRLLVIPPQLAYGSKVLDRIPANSTLIFHVELTRVKFANPRNESDTASVISVEGTIHKSESPLSIKLPDKEDGGPREDLPIDTVNERTKSISEQLSKTPDTKTKLLERMSKMGQAMIPTPSVSKSDDPTDSPTKPEVRQSEHSPAEPESPRPSLKPKPDLHASKTDGPDPYSTHHPQPPVQPLPQHMHHHHQPQPGYGVGQQMMYQQPLMPQQPLDPSTSYIQQPQQNQLALYQSPQAIHNSILGLRHPQQQMLPTQQQHPPPPATSGGLSSTEMNLLVAEGKLKHNELKNELTRLIDKVDVISTRLTSIETTSKQMQVAVPQHQPPAEMEAAVLMQNITRIISENTKLQTECDEKSKKIEKLNESITDLLTKNQSYFEKSNQLLASQSDSMQTNAAQAMAKVSALEQKNIQLEADLASSRTQMLHAHKKGETYENKSVELTVKVETLEKQIAKYKEQIENDSSSTNEHEELVGDLREQIKKAKKESKQLAQKLEHAEDECTEVKQDKEAATKNLADLKRKRKEEKTKHEEEMEEIKNQHEGELRKMKQRYGKNANNETEKLNQLEDELTAKHEERMKAKVNSMEKQHREKMSELTQERNELGEKLKAAEEQLKLASGKTAQEYEGKLRQQLSEANERHEANLEEVNKEKNKLKNALQALENKIKDGTVDSNENVKVELARLQSKNQEYIDDNNSLKDSIVILQEEFDKAKETLEKKEDEIQKLQTDIDEAYDKGVEEGRATLKTISQASYARGFKEGKDSVETNAQKEGGVSKEQVTEEIKKVMNSVFFQLKGEFTADETYDGKEVVGTILNVVREVTLKLVKSSNDDDEEEEESNAEESEEEEDDDEVESEEEEETKEIEKVHLIESGKIHEEDTTEAEKEEAIETKQEPITNESSENTTIQHPSEEGSFVKSPDTGLDVTRECGFDEVDDTDGGPENELIASPEQGKVGEETESENTKNAEKEEQTNTQQTHNDDELSDDDDNVSFSSVTSEPAGDSDPLPNMPNQASQESTPTEQDLSEDNDKLKAEDSHQNQLKKEDDTEATKNHLQDVGLDSSMFGTTEPDNDATNNSITSTLTTKQPDNEDESSLFFGSTSENTTDHASQKQTENKKEQNPAPSLFDDDDDDDFFTKAASKSTGKPKASAYNRSPPPLFDDDDGDTNWI